MVDRDLFLQAAEAVGKRILWVDGERRAEVFAEERKAAKNVGSLRIDVDQPELARMLTQRALESAQNPLERWREKGVVEVQKDGGEGEIEGGRIPMEGGEGAAYLPGRAKSKKVRLGNGGKAGIELHTEDYAKGMARGEQERAAFAAAKIDEGEARPVWCDQRSGLPGTKRQRLTWQIRGADR